MGNLLICECGKEFNYSQSFNGHKRHCKIHLAILGKDHLTQRAELNALAVQGCKSYFKKQQEEKTLKWINEHHTCEKCGKVMTEKWGSGRFCSASCANSRPKSLEERAKISKGVATSEKFITNKEIRKQEQIINEKVYLENPNHCSICNSVLSYHIKDNKTCGDQICINEFLRRKQLEKVENGTHKGWLRRNELSYPEQFWKKYLIITVFLMNMIIQYQQELPIIC